MGRNNESDTCAVPRLSQGSAAAAESCMYLNDDTCLDSTTDFGPFQDGDDAMLPKSCLPKHSPKPFDDRAFRSESLEFFDFNPFDDDWPALFPTLCRPVDSLELNANGAFCWEDLKMIEKSLFEAEGSGCQSSVTNCVSFAMSCGGATASASCNNSVSLQNHMNEEDPVDSLPQPLHQDENEQLNNHAVKCQSYEISNSYKETTFNNDEASRPDASVDPQNFSNSIEMDYNEETSQPDEKLEIDKRKKNYEMSQPLSLSPSKRYLDHTPASDLISGNDYLSNLPKEWSNESNKGPGSSLFLGDVKYKVKSFTTPEFFVEVPESASVGFLEKAILEKATVIIGGGRYLDVLSLGGNARDENEFTPMAITSHQNKLDVILEPEYSQDLNGSIPKLSCIPPPPMPQTRCTPLSSVIHQGTTDTSPDSFMSLLGMTFQDNHERLKFQTNAPIANSISSMTATTYSKVNGSLDLPPKSQKVKAFKCKKRLMMDENTLDVGAIHQKPNSSEIVKRRNIEYFSILEVEKLVKAVEELGTGSWAKIKEQAFGQDSRRTRTDLRDKWETLLKTAETPSKKRRGPKLPQELLDKVVAIKTRNSQHRDLQS